MDICCDLRPFPYQTPTPARPRPLPQTPYPMETPEQLKKLGFRLVTEILPRPNEQVIAVTPSFRCLATLDAQGHWHAVSKKAEALEVIAWLPPEANQRQAAIRGSQR